MRTQSLTRTLLVCTTALTLFLLMTSLLIAAYSNRSMPDPGPASQDAISPRSPSAINRVLLPRSTAAYNGITTPAKTLYAPWLQAGTSVLRVHNTSTSDAASVRATFTYTGSPVIVNLPLGPGAVGEIETDTLPPRVQLSAIITATQPIVAVANDFGLEGKQASSYAAMPASLGDTFLVLPDVFSNSGGGWDSEVAVQNVGQTATNVTVVYTQTFPTSPQNWPDAFASLSVGATHTFRPSQAGMVEGSVGIATIRADQDLVAIVRNAATELNEFYPRQVYIYRAPLPGAANGDNLYFPFLINDFRINDLKSWRFSEVQLVAARSSSVPFTLEITGSPAVPGSIPAWSAISYRQDVAGSQSPIGIPVSGRVQNVQALHGLVWLNGEGGFVGDSLAAYSAFGVGAQTWYLPYADQGVTFATYIAVQNLASTTANVTITPHDATGALAPTAINIGGQTMVLLSGDNVLPLELTGGVTLESNQPVVAIAVIAGRQLLSQEIYMPMIFRNG